MTNSSDNGAPVSVAPTSSEDQFPRAKVLPRQSPLFWVAEKDHYFGSC
jgi:hypothetical protein